MSLFDRIRCKIPLPVNVPMSMEFQTKSFPNPYQDDYEIREDGTLWVYTAWPIGNHQKDWQPCIFSGDVFMYTDFNDSYLEIRVRFEDGSVEEVRLEEYDRQ